jgi:HK97 family phage portal protein
VILATRHGDRELRTTGEWGTEHIIPSPDGGGVVPLGQTVGLPAVGAAIRLYSATVASLPLNVFEGEDDEKTKRPESWQHRLFEFPNDEVSRFSFYWDIESGLESCGNAFIYKARMTRRKQVGALSILQPQNMTVKRDFETNELIYEWWNGRERIKIPRDDVLHIRGDTLGGGDIGYSPLQVHRYSLMTQLQREQFEGKHFQNDARPGVALMFPQGVTEDQARTWADAWDARHQGAANRGRTGVLGGGADLKTFPINLEEQQWVESQKFSVQDVARMYGIPAALLEEGDHSTSEEESLRWLKFGLGPRLVRIQKAFKYDRDLFGRDTPLYPEFFVDDFLRSDAVSMAQVQKEKVQSGIWLVDEARAKDGMPPLADGAGQVPQLTPVGGAPNPAVAATNGTSGE